MLSTARKCRERWFKKRRDDVKIADTSYGINVTFDAQFFEPPCCQFHCIAVVTLCSLEKFQIQTVILHNIK